MNKKIMIGSILAVLMLVAISFSAAAVSNQSNDAEKKKNVSPLFGIRTKDAIGEKTNDFKAKFLENRVFLRLSLISFVQRIFKPLVSVSGNPEECRTQQPLKLTCQHSCPSFSIKCEM